MDRVTDHLNIKECKTKRKIFLKFSLIPFLINALALLHGARKNVEHRETQAIKY